MILRQGDFGSSVILLQNALGITADGDFGPATKSAVIAFQRSHGLTADGIVGPVTQNALKGIAIPPAPGGAIPGDNSDYRHLFDTMEIRSNWIGEVNASTNLILRGQSRYEALAAKTNVPWYLIGCIHLLEGSCNFNTHLHNGDSLKARTHNVPAGRPRAGNPPFTWEESALDALAYDHITPPLNSIGQQFSALEHFNGMGYRSHGINTPYLWSGSNHYVKGKYVSDGQWSSTAVSQQVGAACIYKMLDNRGIITI